MARLYRLRGLSKLYPPSVRALEPLTLDISAGEFLFVAGASGAGKTTLLRLLYMRERANSGELLFKDKNVLSMKTDELLGVRRAIAVVFQDYLLLPRCNALENVAASAIAQGVRRTAAMELAAEMLGLVGLGERLQALPHTLSGGEQQRVALARALLMKPDVLIADEPTGNLDPEMSAYIFKLLEKANQSGVTVIVATHNFAAIDRLKKRTLVLDRGKLVGDFPGDVTASTPSATTMQQSSARGSGASK